MAKITFQTGDRVIITDRTSYGLTGNYKGWTGTAVATDGNPGQSWVDVKLDKPLEVEEPHNNEGNNTLTFLIKELELLPATEPLVDTSLPEWLR